VKVGTKLILTCDGCGEEFVYSNRRGRNPRWCSNLCRKRTLYSGTCEVCGAPTNGSNGREKAPKRCAAHNPGWETVHSQAEARTKRMLALRRQGLLNHEIAEREGVSVPVVADLLQRRRVARFDLDHIASPYNSGPRGPRKKVA
jgi:hypothetical protein